MATIAFHVPTAALGQALYDNLDRIDLLSFSTSAIDIGIPETGVKLLSIYGSFQFSGGQLSGGTLTGLKTYLIDGSVEVEASGFSLDLLYMVDLLLSNPDPAALEEAIFGGADLITGSSGADDLPGYGGNDTIDGGAGIDTMSGDGGNDLYHVRDPGDLVVETDASLLGGGNDTVLSYLASYTLPANVEVGTIMYGGGARLAGNAGSNVLNGAAGADTLVDGAGNDTLDGNGGNDTLVAGAGNDGLIGDAGIDLADYSAAKSGVVIDLSITQQVASGGLGADALIGIENVKGGAFADLLHGNNLPGRLMGGDGADTLDGGGGTGADTLLGGNGGDTYHVRIVGDTVSETNASAAGGVDTVLSWLTSYTLGANVENGRVMLVGTAHLTGNALANVLTAGAGSNRLSGGGGSDTADYGYATAGVAVSLSLTTAQATGGSGSDTLTSIENLKGSDFADRLTGSTAANALRGAAGNDTLTGGSGHDTLTGGGGNDIFRFLGSLTGNVDTVTDFTPGRDRLELENGVFAKLTATGALAAANFRANASGTAVDGNDYLVYETDTGKLFYDADGSGTGAAVQIALLTGAPVLAAGDIFVT